MFVFRVSIHAKSVSRSTCSPSAVTMTREKKIKFMLFICLKFM